MSSKARARSQLKLDCARVSIHPVALPQTPCQEPRTNAQPHLVKLASRFVPSAWKPFLNPGVEAYPEVLKALGKVVEGTPQLQTYEVSNSTIHKIATRA